MNTPTLLAKQVRDVCFDSDWVAPNLKDQIAGLTWEQANTKVNGLNSINALINHVTYYVGIIHRVLKGGPLEGNDKLSWEHSPLQSQAEWEQLQVKTWADIEAFAQTIEQMEEAQIWADFDNGKYGHNYQNLLGFIAHFYYHLGQIALIKRLVLNQ